MTWLRWLLSERPPTPWQAVLHPGPQPPSNLAEAGWINPDGTQAQYSPDECDQIRAQIREGNRLAKEAVARRQPPQSDDDGRPVRERDVPRYIMEGDADG